MTKSSYAHISPKRLIEVCDYCIKEHQEYTGGKVVVYSERKFSILKMRFVNYDVMDYPRWTMRDCGLIARLNKLKGLALAIQEDTKVKDRDIRLSESVYTELMKMYNKDNSFEPYIFAAGY